MEITTMCVKSALLVISVATLTIAYSQMRIASAKTKLDLYNKRFNVYATALDYHQATWHKSNKEIKEQSIAFTKSYRESQFLFDSNDGIYATLGEIQQNGAKIYAYLQYKYEIENNLTNDRLDLNAMLESSNKARSEFDVNLKNLEKQIEKYILFKTITGWNFFK